MRRAPLLAAAALLSGACVSTPPGGDADPRFAEADGLFSGRNWTAAAAAFAALSERARTEGDAAAVWRAELGRCRSTFAAEGYADAALSCFDRVLSLAEGVVEREIETAYHGCLSTLRVGRMQDAEAWGERAVRAAERTSDAMSRSMAYATLGNVRSYQGRYRESRDWNARRVEVWRESGSRPEELARSLNNLAIDLRHLGRYDEAAAALEEALKLYRAAGNEAGTGPVLSNLSNVRSQAGDEHEALRLKLEALAVAERSGSSAGMGLALNDLGEMYRSSGDFSRAAECHERSLAIHREDRRAYGEARALAGLARLELDRDRPAEAAAFARSALALADAGDLGKEQASLRGLLALAEVREGRVSPALDLAREGLRRALALEDPEVELEAREALAEVLERAGRAGEAADAYVAAVELLDSLRGRLELGDLRLGVADLHLAAHEGAIRNLLASGRVEESFAVGERARARLLLELVAEHVARAPRDEISGLRARLRERHAERVAAQGPRRDALDAELARLEAELDAAILRERALDPARAASRHPRPCSLSEIRASIVRPDRPLIAWFWGERRVYGWRVDASGVRGADLGSAPALSAQLEFLHQALASPADAVEWRGPAHAVHRRLLAPLSPAPFPNAVVVPDGPLLRVPLEALLPEPGGAPLGFGSTLYYGPSASVLVALASAAPAGPFDRDLLAIGVPAGFARDASSATRGDERPLPFAAREVRAIAGILGDRECDLLIGGEATPARFHARRPERYRRLHFATHARVIERPAERSCLRLHGGNLDLASVRALRLRAEVVTLSACETALGRRMRGEGVVGLTHAFLSAGARGVVASLWKVEDRATAAFMETWYRRLADGVPPARALREARVASFGADAPPSVWAGFVLVGGIEGQPPAIAPTTR